MLTEVLQLFLQEVPPRIDRLRIAWAAGNIEEVYRAAHSLKGSAGNIGAQRLFGVCQQLDEMGRAGRPDRGRAAGRPRSRSNSGRCKPRFTA